MYCLYSEEDCHTHFIITLGWDQQCMIGMWYMWIPLNQYCCPLLTYTEFISCTQLCSCTCSECALEVESVIVGSASAQTTVFVPENTVTYVQ